MGEEDVGVSLWCGRDPEEQAECVMEEGKVNERVADFELEERRGVVSPVPASEVGLPVMSRMWLNPMLSSSLCGTSTSFGFGANAAHLPH